VNEEQRDCVSWVEQRFPGCGIRWIVETTRSSLASLSRVLATATGETPMLVSTVDAWCPDRDFVAFADEASGYPPGSTVLAVTPFVADERPLPVVLEAGNRITAVGDPGGTLVTAGLYVVPERVRRLPPPRHLDRLRDFLRWLVERGEPVYGVVLPAVIDVDRPEDVALAESWEREGGKP
jgi:NDP-sugar pyrophosphorylase family protein